MKKALIFGRACGVWDEIVEARRLAVFEYTIAVGKAGCDYPGHIDHWVSDHAELFEKWAATRRRHFFPMTGIMYWTASSFGRRRRLSTCDGIGINQVDCIGGSSGLIAVRVAQALGADRIVLAGIPMDSERGHYDEKGSWELLEVLEHRKVWVRALEEENFRLRVRSMSGWSKNVLGYPDKEWLW